MIDIELQARLLVLHDRQRTYTAAPLHAHHFRLEHHLTEAQSVSSEHALIVDARQALTTVVQLLGLI